MEKIIVRCMDWIHKIFSMNERPHDGYTWFGRRLARKQTTPDTWKHMSNAAKKKAKKRWAIQKPKLENDRELRGIFFTEPNDEEFKLTMKTARRKMAVPLPAAVPCKITDEGEWRNPPQYWETQDKTRLYC